MMSILKNVKNRKRVASRLIIPSALIALSIGGMSSIARAEEQGSGLSAPIEGTWILTNYTPGEPRHQFLGLAVVHCWRRYPGHRDDRPNAAAANLAPVW